MTIFKLGYVAMSVNIKNCSPSQTMTHTQFQKLEDRQAAISKLERIAQSNIENCLRLLKHNVAHDIYFFRLSSRLIPLATHEALQGWNYIKPLREALRALGAYVRDHHLRVDFHPDHFVILNSPREEVLQSSITQLKLHYLLLKGMDIDPLHRCVLHIGGQYKNTDEALERFIQNYGSIPRKIQRMIILENDDKSFHLHDTLYLCEKLQIPLVFDYHHHLAHNKQKNWEEEWERVVRTWEHSPLPLKMHISSPKNKQQFRSHADNVEKEMLMEFVQRVNGSVEQIDCMIEAKNKDSALFQLVKELKKDPRVELIDQASFRVKD